MPNRGVVNNPNGRPVGSQNKVTLEMRERITLLFDSNYEQIQTDIDRLEPKDRLKFIVDLLPYVISKLQAAQIEKSEDVIIVTPKNAS